MKDTGERQIPSIPGTLTGLDTKHTERYAWATGWTYKKRIYDVACGTGYGCELLKAEEYTGFDNSPEAVEYARKYYGHKRGRKFEIADATHMPEGIKPAEVIVSFETIEHLKQPEEFLKWAAGHTQTAIISTPIRGSFGRSRWHIFEYRLEEFKEAVKKYFSQTTLFIQKDNEGIRWPVKEGERGVVIAVCQV